MTKNFLYALLLVCISVASVHPAARPGSAAAAAAAAYAVSAPVQATGESKEKMATADRKLKEALQRVELGEAADHDRYNLKQRSLEKQFEQEQLLSFAQETERKEFPSLPEEDAEPDQQTLRHTTFHSDCKTLQHRNLVLLDALQRQLPAGLPLDIIFSYLNASTALLWSGDTITTKTIVQHTSDAPCYLTSNASFLDNNHIVYIETPKDETMPYYLVLRSIDTKKTLKKRNLVDAHDDFTKISCHPNGNTLATTSKKGLITFWDKDLNECGHYQLSISDRFNSIDLSFSRTGNTLAIVLKNQINPPELPKKLQSSIFFLTIEHQCAGIKATHYHSYTSSTELYPYNHIMAWTEKDKEELLIYTTSWDSEIINPKTKVIDRTWIPATFWPVIDSSARYSIGATFPQKTINSVTITLLPSLQQQERSLIGDIKNAQRYFFDVDILGQDTHEIEITGIHHPTNQLLIMHGHSKDKYSLRQRTSEYMLIIDTITGAVVKAFAPVAHKGYQYVYVSTQFSPDRSKMLVCSDAGINLIAPKPILPTTLYKQYQEEHNQKMQLFCENLNRIQRYSQCIQQQQPFLRKVYRAMMTRAYYLLDRYAYLKHQQSGRAADAFLRTHTQDPRSLLRTVASRLSHTATTATPSAAAAAAAGSKFF